MRPGAHSGFAPGRGMSYAHACKALLCAGLFAAALALPASSIRAQQKQIPTSSVNNEAPRLRARRFLDGRGLSRSIAGQAMASARGQQAEMLEGILPVAHGAFSPSGLNAAWQPLGPAQVASLAYGKVTGRVTAIAVDPA